MLWTSLLGHFEVLLLKYFLIISPSRCLFSILGPGKVAEAALRRARWKTILRRPRQVHVERAGRSDGVGRVERHKDRQGHAWRDQPCQLQTWHH